MSIDSRLKIDLSAVLVFSVINTLDSFGLVSLISADCYLLLWQEFNFLIIGDVFLMVLKLLLILVLVTRKHSKKFRDWCAVA